MKRRVVAAFLSDIYQDMVKETQYGTIREAKKQNVKLLFFASFSDNFSNTEYTRLSNYDIGDSAIYKLPNLNNFDGLITYDSYMPDLFLSTIEEIKKDSPIPVVTLGDVSEYSHNVINDHDRSMVELIEHLILKHGCTDLVHVAGNLDLSFCVDRLNLFKKTLKKHDLDCSDDRIYQGNLWYDCAQDVVTQILDSYKTNPKRLLPDAIVCANDYMAIGIIKELEYRGYEVPNDVIVTGYDDVIQTKYNVPSVTTSAQPFDTVGGDGIKVLAKLWNNEEVPHITKEPGVLRLRKSCGCLPENEYLHDQLSESYSQIINSLGQLSRSSTNLILSVSSATSDVDVFDEIEANCCRDTGFSNAVLCLINDWDKKRVITSNSDFNESSFEVVCGLYNGRSIRRGPIPKGQLLPDIMMNDPEAYYLVPIHHMQYFMVYFIISPDLRNLSQSNIKSWFINISTMLENWRVRRNYMESVENLRRLYITDMLTGLFNRRGYALHFEDYYNECLNGKTGLAVFLIDMDNMKMINDNFGHEEGDYCLCAIGNSLTKAATRGEICIRSGGDEFVVLAKNYDEKMVKEYTEKFRKYIEDTYKNDKKDFEIVVSIGCYIKIPEKSDSGITDISEFYLREADKLMYVEKQAHKKTGK